METFSLLRLTVATLHLREVWARGRKLEQNLALHMTARLDGEKHLDTAHFLSGPLHLDISIKVYAILNFELLKYILNLLNLQCPTPKIQQQSTFSGSVCTSLVLVAYAVLQFWWFKLLYCCNFGGSCLCSVAVLVVLLVQCCNLGGSYCFSSVAILVVLTVLLQFRWLIL